MISNRMMSEEEENDLLVGHVDELLSTLNPLSPFNTPPTSTLSSPPSTPIVNETPSLVYQLSHDNHTLYCIKRQSGLYFLQKHLGMAFYNNVNTFNSICWTHK